MAILIMTKSFKDCGYVPHGSRESIMSALPQGPNIQLDLPVSISLLEMQALLLRF